VEKITEIEKALDPALAQNHFELIETQYRLEDGKWVVRLFIDKIPEGGVTLEDCSKVSDLAGDVLDASQVLTGNYVLEVSSPGVNRLLKTEAHFNKAVGQRVKVSAHSPLSKESVQKNFKGVLMGFENGALEVDDATSGRVSIPLSAVAKANLDLI
jgi:ribosome maturation factor RimP